jgi:hypothetical protein
MEVEARCGMVWLDKQHFIQHNLDLLVQEGYLTAQQAYRAREHDVRPGDPECLAYAAYGLRQSKVTEVHDAHKRLTSIAIDYRCELSPIPCPGVMVQIIDGRVTGLSAL